MVHDPPTQTQPTQPSAHNEQNESTLSQQGIVCRLVCTAGVSGRRNFFDLVGKTDSVNEWIFGRNGSACDFELASRSNRISNKHFRIWINMKSSNLMIQDLSTNGTWVNNEKLVKGTNYILQQGDEISVGNGVPLDVIKYIVVFPRIGSHDNLVSSPSIETENSIHNDFFVKDEVIGSGAFATVKKAIERSSGETFAVKIINKKKALTGGIESVNRELAILQKLHHPGIVRLKNFYEDDELFYLVMEYVPGGDLMDFVAAYGSVGELAGKEISKQILEAVEYVHGLGISHRDLKPDNILIAQDDPVMVKVTDFGLAKGSHGASRMKTFCGTLAYVAPEVVSGKKNTSNQAYSSKVDMWSLGCLIFVILTSHLPFSGSTQEALFKNINLGNYHESLLKDVGVSPEGRDFISKLLEVDVDKRFNANQALRHNWFNQNGGEGDSFSISLSQSQSHQQRRPDLMQSQPQPKASDLEMPDVVDGDFKVPKKVRPMKGPDDTDFIHSSTSPVSSPDRAQIVESTPKGVFLSLCKLSDSVRSIPSIHIQQGQNPFSIGRNGSCHFQISDDRMSKIHCLLLKKRHPIRNTSIYESPAMGLDDIWLLDFSTNACFLNNVKVGKGNKAKVCNGDVIHLFKDNHKREKLGFKVVLHDGTGLFNQGEKPDIHEDEGVLVQDSNGVRIFRQEESDKKLFPRLRMPQQMEYLNKEVNGRYKRSRYNDDAKRTTAKRANLSYVANDPREMPEFANV